MKKGEITKEQVIAIIGALFILFVLPHLENFILRIIENKPKK